MVRASFFVRGRGRGGFAGQEGHFAGLAPAIAVDDAGFADDAVAGNEPGDGIRAAGGTDGPGGAGLADSAGEPAVTGDATFRDAQERAPDFELEGSAANEGF